MLIFNILDRYIGKTVFNAIILSNFVLIPISGIIRFMEQLKQVGTGQYNSLEAAIYTLLNMPKDLQIFFPMNILLGVLLGLSLLVQHNELLVMQSSNFSRIQIFCSVMKIVFPLTLLVMIMGETIISPSERIARNYRTQALYGNTFFFTKHRGLWIKDKNNIINISYVKHYTLLSNVTIYKLNDKYDLQSIIYAVNAKYSPDVHGWILSQIDKSDLTYSNNIIISHINSLFWKGSFTPKTLGIISTNPDALSIRELYNYIDYLNSNEQDSRHYQLYMWNKIFLPLSVIAMVLIAFCFICNLFNFIPIGLRILIGFILGFIFYIFERFFSSLILICDLSPIIIALFPSIIFCIISLLLMSKYSY